jgi:UDP-N-acetylmuramyl pentapeptide synthase
MVFAEGTDLQATAVVNMGGRMRFVARANGHQDLPIELALAGVHNVRNALAAIAVGRETGVSDAAIATRSPISRVSAAGSSATVTCGSHKEARTR